jgi:hypothetical protein
MIYSIHQELASPTVINHALSCHFIHASKLSLVVARGNLLSIYRVYTEKGPYPTARLEQLHEFTLQGVITSMESIKTIYSPLDSILLTFKDAKV